MTVRLSDVELISWMSLGSWNVLDVVDTASDVDDDALLNAITFIAQIEIGQFLPQLHHL